MSKLTIHSGELKRFSVLVRCVKPKKLAERLAKHPEPIIVSVFAGGVEEARIAAPEKIADKYLRHQDLKTEWIVVGDPVED